MNNVVAPIIIGNQSAAVTDLHTALASIGYGVSSEEAAIGFGPETCNAVNNFKTKFVIPSFNCMVDKQTADKLNQLLSQKGLPFKIVSPLFFGMKSDAILDLQEALTKVGFDGIDPNKPGEFEKTTCQRLLDFQKEFGLNVIACYVDEATADKINELLSLTGQAYKVSGKVLNTLNETIPGQKLVAYDLDLIGVGYYKNIDSVNGQWFGDGMQKLGEAISDSDGYYEINFNEKDFADAEEGVADVVVFALSDAGFVTGRSALSNKKDYTNETLLANWDVIVTEPGVRARQAL